MKLAVTSPVRFTVAPLSQFPAKLKSLLYWPLDADIEMVAGPTASRTQINDAGADVWYDDVVVDWVKVIGYVPLALLLIVKLKVFGFGTEEPHVYVKLPPASAAVTPPNVTIFPVVQDPVTVSGVEPFV